MLADGKRLLSTSADNTARVWEIATGRELRRLRHPNVVLSPVPLPDGRRAITGCYDGVVRLWDVQSGTLIRPLVKHGGAVHSVALSPDGTRALSGGQDKTLRMLDIARGSEVRQFEGISAAVASVAFSPDGRRVLAGGDSGVVYLGNAMSSDPVRPLAGHSSVVWSVAFAPDGEHAVSGAADGSMIYWDLDAQRALRKTRVDGADIRFSVFESGGRHVIFSSPGGNKVPGAPGMIGKWDVTSDGPPRQIAGVYRHLGLAVLPHDAFATADDDGLVRIWERSAAIARARELSRTGKRSDALVQYDRAVAARPNDPRLLIERGRLVAMMGQGARAAEDFEKAARLAPDSPGFFLDAGWWVAGPYPVDYSQGGALEHGAATDPSRLAPPLGNTNYRWHDVAPGMRGFVDFEKVFHGDNIVGYAMTDVYAAGPREAVLLLGNDDTARIWINGREVFYSATTAAADSNAFFGSLQPGRNTIVAKVQDFQVTHSFTLRFGEAPFDLARAYLHASKWKEAADAFSKANALDPENSDREMLESWARALAEADRWKEAREAFEKIAALDPGNFNKKQDLSKVYLALKDREAFERLCVSVLTQYGKTTDPALANNLIWLVALMPNAVRNYTDWINIGKKLVDHRKPDPNNCNTHGAVLCRAGQYRPALTYLKLSLDAPDGNRNIYDWLFTAMARHKSKQPGDREAFDKARALAERVPAQSWHYRVERSALFEEVEHELTLAPPHN